mmetsp:Transcript_10017/g.22465  ORF Transcript_10017/g.22465 Transcript_10017/m.22465 type:complete len:212 (-) Transcript_10017:1493-2128(-)
MVLCNVNSDESKAVQKLSACEAKPIRTDACAQSAEMNRAALSNCSTSSRDLPRADTQRSPKGAGSEPALILTTGGFGCGCAFGALSRLLRRLPSSCSANSGSFISTRRSWQMSTKVSCCFITPSVRPPADMQAKATSSNLPAMACGHAADTSSCDKHLCFAPATIGWTSLSRGCVMLPFCTSAGGMLSSSSRRMMPKEYISLLSVNTPVRI